jgi:hypothetical protein
MHTNERFTPAGSALAPVKGAPGGLSPYPYDKTGRAMTGRRTTVSSLLPNTLTCARSEIREFLIRLFRN